MSDAEVMTDKSHIRCNIIIEVLGKPKEHVEKTIREYVEKIKKDSDLVVLKGEFSEVEEKEGLFAVFVDLEMVVKGIPKLVGFCFDYMPSSVEIIKPEEFVMNKRTIADFMNDLQARLHHVDMLVKKAGNENAFMKKNMGTAVSNLIKMSLVQGPKSKEDLSKISGVKQEELQLFLDKLLEDKEISEKDSVYSLLQ